MLKILVPVDGSDHSTRALAEAVKYADWTEVQLILLHVREEYSQRLEGLVVDYRLPDHKLEEQCSLELMEYMTYGHSDELKAKTELVSKAAYSVTAGGTGEIAETINKYADEEDVDMIIIGSEGVNAGKIKSVFVGSVTKKVLSHAKCPVLIVK